MKIKARTINLLIRGLLISFESANMEIKAEDDIF